MDAPTFTASKCLNVSVKTQKKERPHESIYSWYRPGKNVFQLHGVGCNGQTVLKKKLTRDKFLPFLMQLEPCLIGMRPVLPVIILRVFYDSMGIRLNSFPLSM
ncbi:putative transposase [Yersinia enterocolitica]|nr:putative transposase [Yersinia enterocolitica]